MIQCKLSKNTQSLWTDRTAVQPLTLLMPPVGEAADHFEQGAYLPYSTGMILQVGAEYVVENAQALHM